MAGAPMNAEARSKIQDLRDAVAAVESKRPIEKIFVVEKGKEMSAISVPTKQKKEASTAPIVFPPNDMSNIFGIKLIGSQYLNGMTEFAASALNPYGLKTDNQTIKFR